MSISKIDPAGLDIGQIGGRRNLIINGAMQVAQRGTSFTGSGEFCLDRYYYSTSGGTLTALTQETLPLGQTDLPSQFRKFLKMDMSEGNNNAGIFHKIEDVDVVEGAVTCSFYAKGTNPGGGKFVLQAQQVFGSGGSTTVALGELADIVLTSSWQRFEVTFTVPSLSGKTVGTGSYLYIYVLQPNGDTSTDAWELNLTGLQLEVGTVATPFEHRSFGEELALCQRYFYRWGYTDATGSSGTIPLQAYAVAPSGIDVWQGHPVEMRARPSITTNGTWSTSNVSSFSGRFQNRQGFSVRYEVPSSGNTFIYANSSDDYFNIDAEL